MLLVIPQHNMAGLAYHRWEQQQQVQQVLLLLGQCLVLLHWSNRSSSSRQLGG
jgi:hypothetical protein